MFKDYKDYYRKTAQSEAMYKLGQFYHNGSGNLFRTIKNKAYGWSCKGNFKIPG